MDNHKDFIHIDDVFKDLRNGEESEPSGAWLRMKDLLDKEMPAGTPVSAGKSFRRYIIPLVALLLAGGGFTYYKLNLDSKNNATLSRSASVIPDKTTGNDKASQLHSGNSKDKMHHISGPETGNVSSGVEKNNNINNVRGHISANSISTDNKNNQDHTFADKKGNSTSNKHKATSTTKQNNIAANTAKAETLKTSPAGSNIASSKVMEEQRVIEEIRPKPASGTSSTNSQHAIASSTASTISGSNTTNPENTFNSNNNPKKIAATLNNQKIVQTADGSFYKEERDTFKRIDIVSRTVASKMNGRNTVKTVMDTVAITRVERVSYLPLNALEMVALRKILVADTRRALIPVADLKERIVSNEMVSLVPLANYKVASRRVDPGKFNQLVQNTSQGIANYFDGSRNFYAALILGGNTSFGNPGAFGLQLGVAGLYQLSERLTLTAELKYVNHYFSNYSLDDQSVTFENINSQQISGVEWLFSGTQKTATSSYKINNFSALEMPITLNYNLGRVSVFGGLNVAYAFPIKWSKENTLNTVPVQQTRTQNENPFLNSGFTIDEQKDFSSRFGLGYVWGLNYDFSRKVSLDARLTQILWDNNKGNTDAIKRLFHVPTLQVSFGYYFGRKDKVVYIMDKR